MTRAPYPIPAREDFTTPNEVIIHVDPAAQPDNFGRVQFTAFWLTDQPWVPGGVRGQVFRTNLDEFTNRVSREGETVRIAREGGEQR